MELIIQILIGILLLFILVSYFIKNDDTKIVIKSLDKTKKTFLLEQFNKGIITRFQVLNSNSLRTILDDKTATTIETNIPENVYIEKPKLVKPTKEQKEFYKKYNQEQNKIMKSDTEFISNFMIDYNKFKNKELTMQDMVNKYKVDSSTIYKRGKRWAR